MNYGKTSLRRRAERAFTLVELLVASVAGLIVAGGVVALSKVANQTFHDELRTSTAELALRSASDRLRLDLARASYMSTPNGIIDPLLLNPVGAGNRLGPAQYTALNQLAGIEFQEAGSMVDAKVSALSAVNGLSPDVIRIAGNLTTGDEYIVQSVQAGSACGGSRISLTTDSPAILRLIGLPNGALRTDAEAKIALEEAFQPTAGAFMVRVVDDTGKSQFGVLCNNGISYVAGTGPVLDLATTLQTGAQTGGLGGTSGFGVGRFTVNPIQIVEWRVRRSADALLDPVDDRYKEGKFDLFRTWIDATGNAVGTPQLVAEYVTDLQFAFGIDMRAPGSAPNVATTRVFGFSDLSAPNTVATLRAYGQATVDPLVGPQRIRSVRFLLATRAALPDRDEPLDPVAVGDNDALAAQYRLRYCVKLSGCVAGTQGYARVRNITGEVTLLNQSRPF